MGSHPLNLLFRFLLEVVALIVAGIWTWHLSDSVFSYVLGVGVPLLMAAVWGIFAVPDDPSRSGKTIIKTPGLIRLVLELAFFGFAYWALLALGWDAFSLVFGACVLVHYVISYQRIRWLLNN